MPSEKKAGAKNPNQEIKELNGQELRDRLLSLKKELADLKLSVRMGKEKNTEILGRKKREIAQILTRIAHLGILESSNQEEEKGDQNGGK